WEGKITFTDWINTTSKVHYAVVEPGHSYGISLEKLADEIAISWTGRLQRATRLAPPDWEDVPITNDQFRIHGNVTDPMAFFRVFPPLDPGKPPGGNFNLSHWKLTLPDADSSEISAARLMAGFTNSFFYTDADGAAVFLSPVTGGPTPGSVYPRCEFRELLNPTNDHVNWTGYGAHIMNGQCKVTRMPSSKKIIIAQIHSFTGNAYPLMKLQFNNGAVQALVKESPNSSADTLFAFAN